MSEQGEGRKFDQGKPRYDLIPVLALARYVDGLTFGAEKYEPDNWRKVEEAPERYFAAAMRHLWAWKRGELLDRESGLPHLAHAMCCISFLLELEEEDRPAELVQVVEIVRGDELVDEEAISELLSGSRWKGLQHDFTC